MKIAQIFFLLLIASCTFKLNPPIEFRFKDSNVEAIATFDKFSKRQSLCFGKIVVKNNNTDKRVLINTAYIENGKNFIRIYPDRAVYSGIDVRRMRSISYDIVAESNCSGNDFGNFLMKVGYDLQNDNVPRRIRGQYAN
jgi:hypothetical protein